MNIFADAASARLRISTHAPTVRVQIWVTSSAAGSVKARGPSSEPRRDLALSIQGTGQASSGVGPLSAGSYPLAAHRHGGPDHINATRRAERSARRSERGTEARFGGQSRPHPDGGASALGHIRGIAH